MSTLRKLILASLLVLLLCPLVSYAQTKEANMLELAREQYRTGNYYFATTWMERILKEYPATSKREEILVMMLKAYSSTGRDAKAAQALDTLAKQYPKAVGTLDPDLLKAAGYLKPAQIASTAPAEAGSKTVAVASTAHQDVTPAANPASPIASKPAAAPQAIVPPAIPLPIIAAAVPAAFAKAAAPALAAALPAAVPAIAATAPLPAIAATVPAPVPTKVAKAAAPVQASAPPAAVQPAIAATAAAPAQIKDAQTAAPAQAFAPPAAQKVIAAAAPSPTQIKSALVTAPTQAAALPAALQTTPATTVPALMKDANAAAPPQASTVPLVASVPAVVNVAQQAEPSATSIPSGLIVPVAATFALALASRTAPVFPSAAVETKRAEPPAVTEASHLVVASLAAPATSFQPPTKSPEPDKPSQISAPTPVTPPAAAAPAGVTAVRTFYAEPARITAVWPICFTPTGKPEIAKELEEPADAAETLVADTSANSGENAKYTLQIGEYVVKSALEEAKRKIRNAGLAFAVEQGPKKKGPMTRLYVGEFPSQEAARKELHKLRAAKIDGFFLMDEDKKFHVYAGSFANEKRAEKELQRIAARGMKLSLKQVVVAVPTYLLTAGSFPTRVAALAMALELERQGVNSVVLERAMPGLTTNAGTD